MSDRWAELLDARARVVAADARIADGVGALRHRLAPATLAAEGRRALLGRARDARDEARTLIERGARAAAANPARTALVAAALVAFLARHRIADAATRVTSGPRNERTNRGRSQ